MAITFPSSVRFKKSNPSGNSTSEIPFFVKNLLSSSVAPILFIDVIDEDNDSLLSTMLLLTSSGSKYFLPEQAVNKSRAEIEIKIYYIFFPYFVSK